MYMFLQIFIVWPCVCDVGEAIFHFGWSAAGPGDISNLSYIAAVIYHDSVWPGPGSVDSDSFDLRALLALHNRQR